MRIVGATLTVLALGAAPAGAVVGGKPVPPGQMRAVADIYIAGAFGCTGSLIAPRWVMTAGHCGSATGALSEGALPTTVAFPAGEYTVQLDSVYADGHGGESHQVSQVLVDSDYGVSSGAGNDVTLLQLADASKAPPLQIAAVGERDLWKAGVLATIAGFGTTSESAQNAPDQMQEAQVPIVDDATCAKDYPPGSSDGSFDAQTMVCAGYPQGGKDTCQGDSGGPLLVPTADGGMRLAGATSFGSGCAQAGKPGVYARIAQDPIRSFVKRFVPGAFAPEPSGPGPVNPAYGRVALVSYSRVSRSGRLTIRLRCTAKVAGGCHGKAFVRRRGSATKADSAVASYRIATGVTGAVTVRLSAALQRQIRKNGPQRRSLGITALDGSGHAIGAPAGHALRLRTA